jgi:copper chaperone
MGDGDLRVTTHAQARAVRASGWSKERTDSEGPESLEANLGQRRCVGHPLGEMARRRDLPYRSRGTWRPTQRSARRSPRRRRKRSKQRAHPDGMRSRQRRPAHGCMRSRWPPAGDTRICIAARPLGPLPGSARSRVQLFVARDARSLRGQERRQRHQSSQSQTGVFFADSTGCWAGLVEFPHLVPKNPAAASVQRPGRVGRSTTLYDRTSNAVTTLSHRAHLHVPAQPAGPPPEGIRSGVMKGAVLRYQDMNESKRATTPFVHTTRLSIVGMSCGACVRHVTTALNGLTGVVHVDVDLPKNEAVVDHLLDRVNEAGLIEAITDAGYHASVLASTSEAGDRASQPAPAPRATGCCCG